MTRFKLRQLFSGVIIATTLALPLAPALGAPEDQAAVDKLVEMNKKALADYDARRWSSAKKILLEAVSAGRKAGLGNHGIMARTHLHLGVVLITGFKDKEMGVLSFTRAIEIDPSIQIRAAMLTPALTAAFEEARSQVTGGAPAASAPSESPPAREATGAPADPAAAVAPLDCPNSGEVPPNKAATIRCTVAPNLPIATVFLFFRGPGKQKFSSLEMEKTPTGWYQRKIPKKVVTEEGAVHFYVEGRDANGKPIVSNGHVGSPNILLVREGAGSEDGAEATALSPEEEAEAEEEENPLEGTRRTRDGIVRTQGPDTRYGKRRFWIGLGGGSGAGYAKGDGLEANPALNYRFEAGAGWASIGHLAPEIGYHLTPDVALSIQGRVQWIPQAAKYQTAQSVLARLLLFSEQHQLRWFGSVMAGGGTGFRFSLHPDETNPAFKDTVRGGPILAGLGGGLSYEVAKAVSLVVETNLLAGFPAFSAVADLNVAVQVNIY